MIGDSALPSLEGLTVISQEQALALPYCTLRLAMKGARVIRLEAPQGDPNRYVGQPLKDHPAMNSYFLPPNAGKEAITLNLKEPEGKRILHDLIRKLKVDVFCTNQIPRNYEGLGVDYETLRSVKEDIIWVGLSGFGPERSEPAYDPIMQAMTGLMDETGEPERDPMLFGVPIVDLEAGNQAYTAIIEALYKRERTGKGSRIDVSMAQCGVSLLVTKIPNIGFGEPVGRYGNMHRFFAPCNTYPTRDGFVYMATGNDRQWKSLVSTPHFSSLDEPRYGRNAGRIADVHNLNDRLRALTAQLTTDEMLELCRSAGVAASRVYTVLDVLNDDYFRRMLWSTCEETTGLKVTLAPPPVDVPNRPDKTLKFPPGLGEHNEAIFGGVLGYSADQISSLKERGVI